MKLYLCGGGSGKQILAAFLSFANSIDKSKPILYIPLAMPKSRYKDCYKWFSKELKIVNMTNFEMVESSEDLSQKNLLQYSAIFIGGGNTYKLLSELKKYNNYEKISEYLKSGGTIFGGSAGAIIFGKNIDSCLIDDGNEVNLQDTKGFDLLNGYSILCHLKNSNLEKNKNYLKEYTKNNKLIYLPEEDVILIKDKRIKFIGTKKYIIFEGDNYVLHSSANFKKDIEK